MKPGLGNQYLDLREFEINALHELAVDDYLHEQSNGPYHLSRPNIAIIVLDSLRTIHQSGTLFVYAACVMSNHVHVVVGLPEGSADKDVGKFIKSHKGFTARMCNRLLDRTGTPFWDPGYFDRTVRQGKFLRVMWYLLNNPVKAGLVDHWEQWPHTWVNPEFELLFKN